MVEEFLDTMQRREAMQKLSFEKFLDTEQGREAMRVFRGAWSGKTFATKTEAEEWLDSKQGCEATDKLWAEFLVWDEEEELAA